MIFRRRKTEQDETGEQSAESMTGTAGAGTDDMEELDRARPRGPWDRSETTADDDGSYVDLGGLLVRGGPGLELRLQINDATQQVEAVLLAGPESGLELRAFAAPRFDSIWDDVRTDIAAEAG